MQPENFSVCRFFRSRSRSRSRIVPVPVPVPDLQRQRQRAAAAAENSVGKQRTAAEIRGQRQRSGAAKYVIPTEGAWRPSGGIYGGLTGSRCLDHPIDPSAPALRAFGRDDREARFLARDETRAPQFKEAVVTRYCGAGFQPAQLGSWGVRPGWPHHNDVSANWWHVVGQPSRPPGGRADRASSIQHPASAGQRPGPHFPFNSRCFAWARLNHGLQVLDFSRRVVT